MSILLAQRRYTGVWSIPGGGRSRTDRDPWHNAERETEEEFGCIPVPHLDLFSLTYPFGRLGFDWKTFVIELPSQPDPARFPDRSAPDFAAEFKDAAWFPIHQVPSKTHWLLYPALLRLRFVLPVKKVWIKSE
jgi:8-oxo-dGTP pyrophosphatase MutT (NUDIX family)